MFSWAGPSGAPRLCLVSHVLYCSVSL